MTKVVRDLLSAVNSGEPSALLSLDISAAFDTLDHHRLLSRAHELFGFSDMFLKWMLSYLSDRQHCVAIVGCRSSFVTSISGVPQGSVLVTFLFSIFTSPVGNIIDSFGVTYHQYADDTQPYTTIKLTSFDKLTSLSACAMR